MNLNELDNLIKTEQNRCNDKMKRGFFHRIVYGRRLKSAADRVTIKFLKNSTWSELIVFLLGLSLPDDVEAIIFTLYVYDETLWDSADILNLSYREVRALHKKAVQMIWSSIPHAHFLKELSRVSFPLNPVAELDCGNYKGDDP